MPKKAPKQSDSQDKSPQDLLDGETFALICKALGHPARIKIINFLRKTDRCVCGKIVEILPLAQSTVSQHLKCLKQAGLIKGEVEGLNICYCLNTEVVEKFKRTVESL
jgi:DNA-binding transcriptional ArsR family regulator